MIVRYDQLNELRFNVDKARENYLDMERRGINKKVIDTEIDRYMRIAWSAEEKILYGD